uniref:Putative ovule protein n=1 Tax=Solanum chacoense TaxID=4108 RepID=A0A0V0HHU0_SOLCH
MKTVSSYVIGVAGKDKYCLTGMKLQKDMDMCMWVHVECLQTTIILLTQLMLLVVSSLCFRLRTSEMTVFCQPWELKGLSVWNGLKILVLSSIHYPTRTNALTGYIA